MCTHSPPLANHHHIWLLIRAVCLQSYSRRLFHSILFHRAGLHHAEPFYPVFVFLAVAQATLLSAGSFTEATALAQALAGR